MCKGQGTSNAICVKGRVQRKLCANGRVQRKLCANGREKLMLYVLRAMHSESYVLMAGNS